MLFPEEKVLEKDVGSWDAEIVVFMDPAPSVSQGRMDIRLVCGGRWLVTDYLNPESGFGGHGVYGWDAAAGYYVGTWVDNMTGTLRVMKGSWDEDTGTMTYLGEIEGPPKMVNRQTTRSVDADTREFRSSVILPDGKEMLVMTATYRRRAD